MNVKINITQLKYMLDNIPADQNIMLAGRHGIGKSEILTEYSPWMPSNTGAFSRGGKGSRGVAHNAKMGSKTFKGIAKAMADQWG